MFISTAYAAGTAATGATGAGEAFMLNMLLIVILVVMFYVLLIMPQQKRFKQHRAMLDELKKGDEIITAGGFLGKVEKMQDDTVVIDLGNNVKVTALKSTIQSAVSKQPANDVSPAGNKKEDKK